MMVFQGIWGVSTAVLIIVYKEIDARTYFCQLGAAGFVFSIMLYLRHRFKAGCDLRWESNPAFWAKVRAVSLRWDPLLAQPCLVLRLEKGRKRVFSPSGDLLYLLRLARQLTVRLDHSA